MKYNLPIETKYRAIFESIRDGKKKIETRACGKYDNALPGDILEFECGDEKFEKVAKSVRKFKNVDEMLEVYKPNEINPALQTAEELKSLYNEFPGYTERLEKFGIIAFEI